MWLATRRIESFVKLVMTFERILCGVDFSDLSVKAFQSAVVIAKATGAELRVVHVIEVMPVGEKELIALENKAQLALEDLVVQWGSEIETGKIIAMVTTGRAFVELANITREIHIDLAVLGAKGVKLLGEPLIGSTTERVLKDTKCSILIVKP